MMRCVCALVCVALVTIVILEYWNSSSRSGLSTPSLKEYNVLTNEDIEQRISETRNFDDFETYKRNKNRNPHVIKKTDKNAFKPISATSRISSKMSTSTIFNEEYTKYMQSSNNLLFARQFPVMKQINENYIYNQKILSTEKFTYFVRSINSIEGSQTQNIPVIDTSYAFRNDAVSCEELFSSQNKFWCIMKELEIKASESSTIFQNAREGELHPVTNRQLRKQNNYGKMRSNVISKSSHRNSLGKSKVSSYATFARTTFSSRSLLSRSLLNYDNPTNYYHATGKNELYFGTQRPRKKIHIFKCNTNSDQENEAKLTLREWVKVVILLMKLLRTMTINEAYVCVLGEL